MSNSSAGKRDEFKVDIERLCVTNNNVLIRVDVLPEDGYVLNSGIIIAGSRFNEAGHVARFGVVEKVPEKLKIRGEHEFAGAMEWGTEMELLVGDVVFFGKMASANSPALIYEDRVYYLINYSEIILTKRNDTIIPLNGYAIVEKVIKGYSANGLELSFGDYQDKRLGVVKYSGSNNSFYYGSDAIDANISVGDTVVFNGGYWTELEYDVFAVLDSKLGYVQKCWINAIL